MICHSSVARNATKLPQRRSVPQLQVLANILSVGRQIISKLRYPNGKLPETTPNATFLVVLYLKFCRRKYGELNFRDETSHSNDPVIERADPRNALQYARQFDDFMSANGHFTIQAAADAFRVSKATVCYYSALIKRLPVELVTWVERTEDPRVLGFLTERRLRPITRGR